jgi:rhodanese-related sulfurtransferase
MRCLEPVTLLVTLAALWIALAGGCDLFKPSISDTSLEDITLPYLKLQKMLADTGHKTVLVDVRSEKKYQAAHIPGALSIPEQTIVSEDARLAEAYNIVVYGGDDNDVLTPVGAKRFLACSYSHVFVFRGGLRAWRDNGNRVDEAPASAPAATQPQTAP